MSNEQRNDILMRLLDALEQYYQYLSAEDDCGRRKLRDTEAWFANTDQSDPYGFEAVCAALSLDPHGIRRTLEQRRMQIRGALGAVPKSCKT